MNPMRYLALALAAAGGIGCTDKPTAPPVSPPIDRFYLFTRNWPTEEVELALIREGGQSTLTVFLPERDDHPRIVLDSVGPSPDEPAEITEMLATFDVWALNAPNAPGAACRTINGQRSCNITFEDYSLVMQVESGGQVRVQRYTHLEARSPSDPARALADFALAWARELRADEPTSVIELTARARTRR
jgi:hypothetical protein